MKSVFLCIPLVLIITTGCATRKNTLPVATAEQNRQMIVAFEDLDLKVEETPRGVAIYFPEVLLFDYNDDRMKTGARAKMHQVATVVNAPQYDWRDVAVEGHADAIGSQKFNLDLSARRARSVARELVFSGVKKERIIIGNFGKSRPIAPNSNPDGTDNPEGRARNRRVEVYIENQQRSNR